jgi:hypothetical protein
MRVRQGEGQTKQESDKTRVRQKKSETNGQMGKRAKEMRVRQPESQTTGESDKNRVGQMGKRENRQAGKRVNE